jgi:hypothetical protein
LSLLEIISARVLGLRKKATATPLNPCKVAPESSWTAHGSDKVFKEASKIL